MSALSCAAGRAQPERVELAMPLQQLPGLLGLRRDLVYLIAKLIADDRTARRAAAIEG